MDKDAPPSQEFRYCSAPGRLQLECQRPAVYVATGGDGLQWFTCDLAAHQVEAADLAEIHAWLQRSIT